MIEGNSGTTNAVFTVSLEQSRALQVTFIYDTQDGTATVSDNDYVPVVAGAGVRSPRGQSQTTMSFRSWGT